jgi:ubiquinone/menaquinone biosynthesis C-methylase UbiE
VTGWDSVRSAYDAMAPAYRERIPDLRAEQPVDRAMITAFGEHVRSTSSHSVLDFGCGTGRLVTTLQELGLEVTGADLSDGMVAIARSDHPEVDFHVVTPGPLPFADESFAGVLAWYSLIHCPPGELAGMLSELVRVLVPGGYVLTGFQAGVGSRVRSNAHDGGHEHRLHLRTTEEMAGAFAEAGLTVAARCARAMVPDSFDGGHDQGFVLGRKPERLSAGATPRSA